MLGLIPAKLTTLLTPNPMLGRSTFRTTGKHGISELEKTLVYPYVNDHATIMSNLRAPWSSL